jgi:hypothetical protein
MDQNELPLEPCNLVVPSGASNMIFEPMVHLAQTMHLSCTNTNIISKLTEIRFHRSHTTKEFHRVRQKWFFKPMVHSAQTVHLSCVKIIIGCVKMISEPMVRLAQTVHLSCTHTIFKWAKMRFMRTHVTEEFHWVRPKWFLRLRYFRCKRCTYLASRLALSPNGPKWASTWAS